MVTWKTSYTGDGEMRQLQSRGGVITTWDLYVAQAIRCVEIVPVLTFIQVLRVIPDLTKLLALPNDGPRFSQQLYTCVLKVVLTLIIA